MRTIGIRIGGVGRSGGEFELVYAILLCLSSCIRQGWRQGRGRSVIMFVVDKDEGRGMLLVKQITGGGWE